MPPFFAVKVGVEYVTQYKRESDGSAVWTTSAEWDEARRFSLNMAQAVARRVQGSVVTYPGAVVDFVKDRAGYPEGA